MLQISIFHQLYPKRKKYLRILEIYSNLLFTSPDPYGPAAKNVILVIKSDPNPTHKSTFINNV